jgi:hypothetical protein
MQTKLTMINHCLFVTDHIYISFGGGCDRTPRTPPGYGPDYVIQSVHLFQNVSAVENFFLTSDNVSDQAWECKILKKPELIIEYFIRLFDAQFERYHHAPPPQKKGFLKY